jgi:acyl CoA:acetate/3-ketoacid CoA transferase alpha subunit
MHDAIASFVHDADTVAVEGFTACRFHAGEDMGHYGY